MSRDAKAIALAQVRAELAKAPRHPGHRHALVVGFGVVRPGDTEGLTVVLLVEAVDGEVYLYLDGDDLAAVKAFVPGDPTSLATYAEPDEGSRPH